MLRKFISAVMVLVLLLSSIIPANAAEAVAIWQAQQVQEEMNRVDELISLSAKAARVGDMQLAAYYEQLLVDMGAEIVVSNNPEAALNQLGIRDNSVSVLSDNVTVPPNTNDVHWVKYSVTNWYNYRTGGNYDLISLTAVSYDDTNEFLHVDMRTELNAEYQSFASSVFESTVEELIAIGLEHIPCVMEAITVTDILVEADKKLETYTTVAIPNSSLSVRWFADRTIRFWYVRSNGSGLDHTLWCVEDSMDMTYLASAGIRIVEPDGSVDTVMVSEGPTDITLNSPGYGDMTRPCDACKNRDFRTYEVGDITFTFAGEKVVADGLWVPEDTIVLQ